MAQLIIQMPKQAITPISKIHYNQDLDLINQQTIEVFREKIKHNNTYNNLEYMLQDILSGVIHFNDYIIKILYFLHKNNPIFIEQIIPALIFQHSRSFDFLEPKNNIPSLLQTFFKITKPKKINKKELLKFRQAITQLKKLSTNFIIAESFFRHHYAHGFSGSLIEFLLLSQDNIQLFIEHNSYHSMDIQTYCFIEQNVFREMHENVIKYLNNKDQQWEKASNKIKHKITPIDMQCFEQQCFFISHIDIVRYFIKLQSITQNKMGRIQSHKKLEELLSIPTFCKEEDNLFHYKQNANVSIHPNTLLKNLISINKIISNIHHNGWI